MDFRIIDTVRHAEVDVGGRLTMGDLFQRWPTIGHLNFGMVPMTVFAGQFRKQAAFQSIFELHGERVKYTTAYSISCLPLVVTPVGVGGD